MGAFTDNTGFIGTTTNHDLAIWTNNAEKMRITNSGNVGIGTTTPNRLLEVSGAMIVGQTDNNLIQRGDSSIEIHGQPGAHSILSSFQTTNPGDTTHECALSCHAYNSAGTPQQIGAFYSRWNDTTAGAGNGYSIMGMHPNYDGGGTADVAFEVAGHHGIKCFGGPATTFPGANIFQVSGAILQTGAGNIEASGAGVFKKNGSLGVGGTFTTGDLKTVTVSGGIIISIV